MIRLENVTRSFGRKKAVDGVSLHVPKGQVLGFLGPNGAGKTTTMRLISGCLIPDAGRIFVCGVDMAENPVEAKKNIGYMPEGAPLYGDTTVFELLSFVAEARGAFSREKIKAVHQAVERVGLSDALYRAVDTLSKGTRRRVALAQALIGDPPVLLLDEPTEGLDPNQKRVVHRLIHCLASEKAVMISTHILDEIDQLCSRAIIFDKGKIVLDDIPRALSSMSEKHEIVSVVVPDFHESKASMVFDAMPEVALKDVVKQKDGETQFLLRPTLAETPVADVVEALRLQNIKIIDISVEKGRLEDVFFAFTDAGEEK